MKGALNPAKTAIAAPVKRYRRTVSTTEEAAQDAWMAAAVALVVPLEARTGAQDGAEKTRDAESKPEPVIAEISQELLA